MSATGVRRPKEVSCIVAAYVGEQLCLEICMMAGSRRGVGHIHIHIHRTNKFRHKMGSPKKHCKAETSSST